LSGIVPEHVLGMGSLATFVDSTDRPSGITARLRAWPPPAAAAVVAFAGFLVLTVVLVALGLLITKSGLLGPIGDWDLSVGRWFELHRTTALNGWTNIASVLGGTGTILLVAGLVVGFLLIRRLWYEAGFLVTGLFIEFAVFLTTSSLVDRPRPTTRPLDTLPVTSSYPSGHVAASIMLYIGWAIITSAQTRSTLARVAIWAFAVLFPICVGLSRIYRGMHHPTDVAASIVLGTGALVFSIYAIRVAAAAAERRRGQHPRRESAEVRA
jgi:membrane-associated phospholipid phosphatase